MQTLPADADTDEADAPDAVTGEVLRRGMRLVWRYAKGQPGPLAVSVAGATVFALSAVGATAVIGWITDELIIPAFEDEVETGVLGVAVAALVGVTVLRAVSIVFRRYFGAMTGRRTQAGLRREVTDRYLDVPLAYHQRTPAGRLLAHAVSDIEAATEVIYPLPFSVGVFALVFFSMVSLVLVDPLMALVAFVLFPTLALLNRMYTKRVEAPSARVQEQVGRVSSVAHESIDGALVVKALGRERAEVDRLAAEADALRRARIEVGRLRALFEPAIDALPNIGVIVLLALGTWAIEEGRVTPGELVQVMALFGILAFPMRVLGYFLEGLPRAVVSIARVDGVLAEPAASRPARPTPLGATSAGGAGPLAVSVEHLVFAYDAPSPTPSSTASQTPSPSSEGEAAGPVDRVLDGVSFSLAPGEIVALVGATGAGKSTLAELLCGLMPSQAGTVRLDGVDLAELDPTEVHRVTGLVFQEAFLFADRIGENIALGADVTPDEIAEAARIAHADAFIRRLPQGYDTVVGERGVSLSGGQRQRVALARALVRRPRLLILDDATSAVDPTVEAAILADLRATLDTTTLIVAHRVSTIELADRVLFLADGRVAASGPHRELLATVPAYEAIVRAYEAEEVA